MRKVSVAEPNPSRCRAYCHDLRPVVEFFVIQPLPVWGHCKSVALRVVQSGGSGRDIPLRVLFSASVKLIGPFQKSDLQKRHVLLQVLKKGHPSFSILFFLAIQGGIASVPVTPTKYL